MRLHGCTLPRSKTHCCVQYFEKEFCIQQVSNLCFRCFGDQIKNCNKLKISRILQGHSYNNTTYACSLKKAVHISTCWVLYWRHAVLPLEWTVVALTTRCIRLYFMSTFGWEDIYWKTRIDFLTWLKSWKILVDLLWFTILIKFINMKSQEVYSLFSRVINKVKSNNFWI